MQVQIYFLNSESQLKNERKRQFIQALKRQNLSKARSYKLLQKT